MKFPATTNSTLAFQKLLEPHKQDYTLRQEKFAKSVRELASLKYPDDKKERSYLDYFDQECNIDLYIKPSKHINGIELNAYNRKTEEIDLISFHKQGFKPKEHHLANYIDYIKDEAKDFLNRVVLYTITALLFLAAAIYSAKTNPSKTTGKKITTEFVQKISPKINCSSIPFLNKLVR